jgi:hypothetical protein
MENNHGKIFYRMVIGRTRHRAGDCLLFLSLIKAYRHIVEAQRAQLKNWDLSI